MICLRCLVMTKINPVGREISGGQYDKSQCRPSTSSILGDGAVILNYRKVSNIWRTKSQNLMFLDSSCSCLYPISWRQVLSREWRCSDWFDWFDLIWFLLYYSDKYRYNIYNNSTISIPSHIGLICHFNIMKEKKVSEHMAWSIFKLQTSRHDVHYSTLKQRFFY